MDISDKIRELRSGIDASAAEEKLLRARINELKQLIAEKAKKDDSLAALKLEEAELLKSLGL
jgi:cell shape-determining protein MreC